MSEFQMEWVGQYLHRQPNAVFDVGTYDGGDAMRFKRTFPSAIVCAFDASPDSIDLAEIRGVRKAGVELYYFAVCDHDNGTIFHPNDDPRQEGNPGMSGSILAPTEELLREAPHLHFRDPIKVPSTRIDTFCLYRGLNRFDILHMDAQGAEGHILTGMGSLRPGLIFLEVDETEIHEGAMPQADVSKLLAAMGYSRKWAGAHDELHVHKFLLS
jgi:FkbM family methyltransferase